MKTYNRHGTGNRHGIGGRHAPRDREQGVGGRGASATITPVAPPPAPPVDELAGPRPVSARQQAHREGRLTGADFIERTVPRRAVPAGQVVGQTVPPGYRRSHVRDSETTAVRRVRGASERAEARRNRRRANWWAASLRVAVVLLVVEVAAVALFSPRLYVTRTTISGNATVPTSRLMALLQIKPKQNIVRLPVGKMRAALLAVPEIDHVFIHRRLPGTVAVDVTERQPWASVCVAGSGCWTIDKSFVPFRATADPEPDLPRLRLASVVPAPPVATVSPTASAPAETDIAASPASPVAQIAAPSSVSPASPAVTLGKPLNLPGLSIVGQCLAWAANEKFPVASVEIAPDGKLCLNKVGGAQIQLGSGMDLDAKLRSLSLLLSRHPELRDSPDLAYINLFDKDGPAVMTKTAMANAANAALAKAKADGAATGTDEAATGGAPADGATTSGTAANTGNTPDTDTTGDNAGGGTKAPR